MAASPTKGLVGQLMRAMAAEKKLLQEKVKKLEVRGGLATQVLPWATDAMHDGRLCGLVLGLATQVLPWARGA